MSFRIESKEQFVELWNNIYKTESKPDWSHMIRFYDDNIYFRDSIQELRGIEEFKAMTERLVKRSKDLQMKMVNIIFEDNIIFFEWEMGLSFMKSPHSKIFGASRMTLNNNGKIIDQRDYYDLWGDILDSISGLGKGYRKFMRKMFG
ncbi:MAG: nuclear transport factor 2 family protein [Candidatus Lokiarchaeota archaeon]